MRMPEHEGNAYIDALPPIQNPLQTYESLSRPPSWELENRELPHVLRRYCVQRLKRYFRPGPRHIKFAEEFGRCCAAVISGVIPARDATRQCRSR